MLNSDNKRSTPISSTQTETDGGMQRLSERSIAGLAQAEKSVVPMSSWLAWIAAEKDRVRKQTFLKEIVAALERLQVCCTDASHPEAIPRQPPVDLYDRVFNYRGKMDGLFWHLLHSYCVIMEKKDGTKRADAQKALKASVWRLYRDSQDADVAHVLVEWLQALKNELEGSPQEEENEDQKLLRSLFAAEIQEEKACDSMELEERNQDFYEQDEEEFQEDLEWYCLKKQAKWDLAEKQLESEVAVKPEKERKELDEAELDELDEVDTVEGESASSTPSRSRSLGSQAEGASPSSCDDLLAIQMDDKVSSLPACLAHMEEDAIAGWILRWLRTQFKTFPNILNV